MASKFGEENGGKVEARVRGAAHSSEEGSILSTKTTVARATELSGSPNARNVSSGA